MINVQALLQSVSRHPIFRPFVLCVCERCATQSWDVSSQYCVCAKGVQFVCAKGVYCTVCVRKVFHTVLGRQFAVHSQMHQVHSRARWFTAKVMERSQRTSGAGGQSHLHKVFLKNLKHIVFLSFEVLSLSAYEPFQGMPGQFWLW
jgi:hypothetical protein